MFEKIARSSNGFLLAAATLLAGCGGDSTAPTTLAPIYDLLSYNGSALPVETRVITGISPTTGQQYTCSDQITAGEVQGQPQHRFQETESTVIKCDDGRPDVFSSTIVAGSYAVSGTNVVLTSDPFDYGGVSATMTMSASLNGDELTIRQRRTTRTDGQVFTDGNQLVFRVHR